LYEDRILSFMLIAPLSLSHDLTRDELVARYRSRIAEQRRNKLGTSERELLIHFFIDRLKSLDDPAAIEVLCSSEISLLEEGYQQSTIAFDYLPKYRKAIEQAISDGTIPLSENNCHRYRRQQRVTGIAEECFEHYALTYLKYDENTYESLDSRNKLTNQSKQSALKAVNPQLYLERLQVLLRSDGKFAARHRAIALAGLTGRRLNEVLARGRFSLAEHPFLLRFDGHSKVERDAYDIVTLVEAERLLPLLNQFREMDGIRDLFDLSGSDLASAINKFDVLVNRECVRFLADVVPPLQGRANISVHNLRSLWGAIAVYFFCPPSSHEFPFLQHFLGHALDSSATGHYFRYRLVDSDGELLTEQGIKIPLFGELPLPLDDDSFDAVRQHSQGETAPDDAVDGVAVRQHSQADTAPDDSLVQHNEVFSVTDSDQDELVFLSALDDLPRGDTLKSGLSFLLLSDRYTQLLTGLIAVTGLTGGDLLKGMVFHPLPSLPFSLSVTSTLGCSPLSRPVLLRADLVLSALARLKSHPAVQPLLYLSPRDIDERCLPHVSRSLSRLKLRRLSQLMEVYSSLSGFDAGGSVDVSPAISTFGIFSDDCSRLDTIASSLNFEGSPAQVFHYLLTWVEQQLERPDSPTPDGSLAAIAHQAHTLAWLTDEVSSLRQKVIALESERDSLLSQVDSVSPSLLADLQSENQRLSSELSNAHSTLAHFRSLLSVPSPPPLPTAVSSAPRRKGSARDRSLLIWKSLQDWNQLHPDNTFALTVGLLESTFHVNRQAAQAFVSEFSDEINAYHHNLGISSLRTHNRGKDPSPLKAFVLQHSLADTIPEYYAEHSP
jgi:hypothetical protein